MELPSGIFSGLSALTSLDLSDNKLDDVARGSVRWNDVSDGSKHVRE